MTPARGFSVAIRFERAMLPENLIAYGRKAEQDGFDELWVVEDLTFNGGVSAAATVLATTERIKVGIGIMPAVVRNPAYVAMELATLARIHPGRLLPGFGHGVASWMEQVGALPESQLAALEETATAVRRLLLGENVSMNGKHVHLDSVKLLLPPDEVPPISLGVRAIRSLTMAGRSADGTILTEGASPAYIRWARAQIEEGLRESGWAKDYRLTVFAHCSVDADGDAARARLRPVMANEFANPGNRVLWEPTGKLPDIDAYLDDSGEDRYARLPDAWLDEFALVGTPAECAAGVRRLVEAGATTVVLVPIAGQNSDALSTVLAAL